MNKQRQKDTLIDIMNADAKDGLYDHIGDANKTMTAVEWLIEQLYSHSGHIDVLDVANLNGYFEQAKQMEKEQIINAWASGVVSKNDITADQYYNETYGSE